MTDLRDVQVFGMNNDTDQWLVIADNRFQLFPTEQEASDVFDKLVGDDIENSCFGVVDMVQPRYYSNKPFFDGSERRNISAHTQVDLLELNAYREALGRDMEESKPDKEVEHEDAFTFEELCEMGLASPSEENKKAYLLNISKLIEWGDNIDR